MKINKLIYKISMPFIALFLFSVFVPEVSAQEFFTSINPTIISIEAEAPARISAPITLENKSNKTTTYGIYLRPFEAGADLNGTPSYNPELASEYESFFNNVQILDGAEEISEIELSPGQSKDLKLRIYVETDQKSSDKYFTVVFLAEPEEQERENSNSIARGGVSTNVLLSIGPKSEAKGQIVKFSTPSFTTKGPVPITLELKNNSNFFVASEGTIIIKNVFGQIVGNLEFGPLNLLTNSSRLASNTDGSDPTLWWNEKYPIGFYKAEARVAISSQGPLLVSDIYFFAVPLQVILVFGAAIIALVWLYKRVRKKASEE